MRLRKKDLEGRAHDAHSAAAARERTADETGKLSDRMRFGLALGKFAIAFGREERARGRAARRARRKPTRRRI